MSHVLPAKLCCECGTSFQPGRKAENLFCTQACRTAYNNRRMKRGAELYDLFMILRFQRAEANNLGVWQLVCRLASVWNEEDRQAGRRSYGTPKRVLARMTVYLATVVQTGR